MIEKKMYYLNTKRPFSKWISNQSVSRNTGIRFQAENHMVISVVMHGY